MWRRFSFISSFVRPTRSSLLQVHQVSYGLKFSETFTTEVDHSVKDGVSSSEKNPFITFVLGGPGCGKGTQCVKIVETFGFTHLSAGDLLRKEIASNSENGAMILETIKDGKIVPSSVTVELIKRAIESSESNKFLIDGFPRSNENRISFERIFWSRNVASHIDTYNHVLDPLIMCQCPCIPSNDLYMLMGMEPELVLFFDCPEEVMVERVLSRNQGRVDDNIETVKKRLEVFARLNLPVINYYAEKGKLHKINAVGTVDEIFEKVWPIFAAYKQLCK